MADAYNDRHTPEHQTPERYEETVDPRNPPYSVTNPAVRSAALRSYLGPLVVFFIVVGLALIYWANRSPVVNDNPAEVGTTGQDVVGERANPDDTPGGFDPAPRPGSTSDEIESRGGGEPAQGPMPGLAGAPLNELGSVHDGDSKDVLGRRIDVEDVTVVNGDARMFWVQDGDAKVAVAAPAGSTAVTPGARVNVSGIVEPDGQGGVRIRATRVVAR